ncbi:hypothetical protein MCEMOHM34_00736 [Candidatus Methylopumilus universalis]
MKTKLAIFVATIPHTLGVRFIFFDFALSVKNYTCKLEITDFHK